MVIVTCANADRAKDDSGEEYENFSFRKVISHTVAVAQRQGYTAEVYDLGELGMGEPFSVTDETFAAKGYYGKEVVGGYKSKSLFKPGLVRLSMAKHDDLVVYLDGDAQLRAGLDEIDTDDYDVGVTLRDAGELESEWHKKHMEIVRFVNAGVIFFRPTRQAEDFVARWSCLTDELGNDQMALNRLCCPDRYPAPWSVHVLDGVRVKYFPGRIYNFYYFPEMFSGGAKVLHFKGSVRHFYPFGPGKKLFCLCRVPVTKLLAMLKK
ncbi:putative nucleotide-diphospho-sugar transferase [Geomonas subterranea]|uniref:putative nucleotide-diphospho-sugar transferase n=1 Tax=Geomonas subterranea TaxID=2847989 RepID=UPI001CD217CD|nr:putative nucleotide-diphospho-sugar transferase [Geomonas fuzhouensis]